MSFTGFPHAAVQFYLALEEENSRKFWATHRADYERHVRGPMIALLADLEESFGPSKVFRPHRDVRFAADKSPYKTHQGGYVSTAEATGWYAEVSADGFTLGAGCYRMDAARLRSYRAAVSDDLRGSELDGDVVTTPLLLDEVRRRWEELRPFVDWLTATA